MHLARAVECPCVIIYGGREAPWQSGYICNFNLYTPLPCAPYWRWNGCECDRQCMREIGVADVVSAIRQMMERPRGPLEVAWTQSRAMSLPESPEHLTQETNTGETGPHLRHGVPEQHRRV